MVSPAKKRKLNGSSEPSPKPARNLDFFFRKQTQEPEAKALGDDRQTYLDGEPELTDEQLARKLQAEWDREEIARNGISNQVPEEARQIRMISQTRRTFSLVDQQTQNQMPYPEPNLPLQMQSLKCYLEGQGRRRLSRCKRQALPRMPLLRISLLMKVP